MAPSNTGGRPLKTGRRPSKLAPPKMYGFGEEGKPRAHRPWRVLFHRRQPAAFPLGPAGGHGPRVVGKSALAQGSGGSLAINSW